MDEENEVKRTRIGALISFFKEGSRSIDDIWVLMMREIEKREREEEKVSHYVSVGKKIAKDDEETNFVFSREKFLTYLEEHLEATFGFDPEVAQGILDSERNAKKRNYKERGLILALLLKLNVFPTSFTKMHAQKEVGIKQKLFLVSEVVTKDGQKISNPLRLEQHRQDDEKSIRMEFDAFPIKEAIKSVHKTNKLHATYITLDLITKWLISKRFRKQDRQIERAMLSDYDLFIESL